mgnify:CR=1 FL=1
MAWISGNASGVADESAQPPGWLYGLVGGVCGAGSELLFGQALWVGLGTEGGVLLFFLIYTGLQ